MKLVVFCLITCAAAAGGPMTAAEMVRHFEGEYLVVYKDSRGTPTVGVGFNLRRADARTQLAAVGADYQKVLKGEARLTKAQSQKLLDICLAEAEQRARAFCQSFDDQPPAVRVLLIDMAFNLGNRLRQFKRFQAALAARDYDKAAQEIQDSKWYTQVGRRGRAHIKTLKDLKQGA